MRSFAVVAAILALAGCLGDPAPPTAVVEPNGRLAETREAGEYWLVRVTGHETTSRLPGEGLAVCSIVFDHEPDAAMRAFRPANASAPAPSSVRAVVAAAVFDEGDCPVLYRHAFASGATWPAGRHGTLDVAVADDGALRVDGRTVPQGERWRATYEVRDGARIVTGELVVENLGAWPTSLIERVR